MLRERILVSVALIPITLGLVLYGGWPYLAVILGVFALAANEYARLFQNQRPARWLIVGGVLAFISVRAFLPAQAGELLAGLCVAALVWHLIDYERGAATSATDFGLTLGGAVYLGWLGSYFVTLRQLPGGQWWLFAAFVIVWISDTGAYTFGRLWGKRKLAPRLSPNKTWFGYLGNIVGGCLGGGLIGLFVISVVPAAAGTALNGVTGAGLGLLIGLFSPLGDLGVSMFKRQVGVKDTSQLLPGHGGMLDRMDSWLIAMPLSYYFALLLQSIM